MDGAVLDALNGKHYELETLDNDLVRVESAGRVIRVGIKDETGTPFSWWEPTHPFTEPPQDPMPDQRGWGFRVEKLSDEVTRATFTH